MSRFVATTPSGATIRFKTFPAYLLWLRYAPQRHSIASVTLASSAGTDAANTGSVVPSLTPGEAP